MDGLFSFRLHGDLDVFSTTGTLDDMAAAATRRYTETVTATPLGMLIVHSTTEPVGLWVDDNAAAVFGIVGAHDYMRQPVAAAARSGWSATIRYRQSGQWGSQVTYRRADELLWATYSRDDEFADWIERAFCERDGKVVHSSADRDHATDDSVASYLSHPVGDGQIIGQ